MKPADNQSVAFGAALEAVEWIGKGQPHLAMSRLRTPARWCERWDAEDDDQTVTTITQEAAE